MLLIAVLVRSWIRLVRGLRHGTSTPAQSRGRSLITTIAWTGGSAAVAAGAAGILPSFWQGADLAKLRLWAPDIGHAIIVVATLATALALTRLAMGLLSIAATRPPAADPTPQQPVMQTT